MVLRSAMETNMWPTEEKSIVIMKADRRFKDGLPQFATDHDNTNLMLHDPQVYRQNNYKGVSLSG